MIPSALLSSRPVRFMAWAVAGLVAFAAWTWTQRSAGARKRALQGRIEAMQGHIDTTERMHDAEADFGNDIGAIRERLRDRDPNKR